MSALAEIRWDKRYSVGCEYIDIQHRNLVGIVNDFFRAVRQEGDREMLASILTRLVRYAEEHFQDEERLAAAAGFPADKLEVHKREHEKLTLAIFHIAELYGSRADLQKSVEETATLLKRWLLDHILDADMQEAPYLSRLDDKVIQKVLKRS
jgi:hemerythrin-like metal-binding protein